LFAAAKKGKQTTTLNESLSYQNFGCCPVVFLDWSSMALEFLGIKVTCHNCHACFSLCRKCWRGHWYCSTECSAKAKALRRQRANKRYRESDQGRLAQQRAQRRHRKRKRDAKTVRDHSSKNSGTCLKQPPTNQLPMEVKSESSCFKCRLCGREVLAFIDGRRFLRPIWTKGRGKS